MVMEFITRRDDKKAGTTYLASCSDRTAVIFVGGNTSRYLGRGFVQRCGAHETPLVGGYHIKELRKKTIWWKPEMTQI